MRSQTKSSFFSSFGRPQLLSSHADLTSSSSSSRSLTLKLSPSLALVGTQATPLLVASCQRIAGNREFGSGRAWRVMWHIVAGSGTLCTVGHFLLSPLSFSLLHQSPSHNNARIPHSIGSQRKSPQEGSKHKSKYDCLKNNYTYKQSTLIQQK